LRVRDAYAAVVAVSEKDVKLLWGRGAERCAFPDCRKVLSKTPETASPGYPLGKQAHIVSHAQGGVRDDPVLTQAERDSYANLILVCAEHHDVIDHEPNVHTVAKLHEIKTQHELWVTESLSTSEDRQKLANELVYATLVDSASENLWLASWKVWTAEAVASTPVWPEDLPAAIGSFFEDVHLANFPGVLSELEWALQTTAIAGAKAALTFEEHAFSVEGMPLLRADQFYRHSYDTPGAREAVEEWDRWCKRCYAWIYEATKAINWLADVVRRDLNPLFFAAEGKFAVIEDNPVGGKRILKLEYEPDEREADRATTLRELADKTESPSFAWLDDEFASE
jgi:hypothetical protein